MANHYVTIGETGLTEASKIVTDEICKRVRNPEYRVIYEQVIEIFMTELNEYLFKESEVKK